MKQLFLSILLVCSLLSFLCGCEKENLEMEPRAVIEGTFSNGGYPDVLFSASVTPGIDGNLAESMINWGKVTISDGEREVILTGRVDNSYMPPFRYYSLDMKGEPGKTYTITADFKNLHARATAYMPYPTQIDSLTLSSTASDSLMAATLHFTSPADTPAFYYVTLRNVESKGAALPSLTGTLRADLPNRHYSIPILRPKAKLDSTKYQANFKIGEKWVVYLNRIEKAVYQFWSAYDNMTLFSASPFISSNESLPSNVEGGYGVWSPQGTSTRHLNIERDKFGERKRSRR